MKPQATIRRQGGQPAGTLGAIAVRPTSALAKYFHEAQARLKRNPAGVKGQKAVAPLFDRPATGDSGFYEVPASVRRQIFRLDEDNRRRRADYQERLRNHLATEAEEREAA